MKQKEIRKLYHSLLDDIDKNIMKLMDQYYLKSKQKEITK